MYREENMKAIYLGFPELYERLQELDETKIRKDFAEMKEIPTLSEMSALCVMTPNGVMTPEGRTVRLNSAYDPMYESKVWVSGQENLQAENILLFGLGNGAFAREVLRQKGENSRVMIYEPSLQLFWYALEHYDLTDFFSTYGVRVLVEGVNEEMYSGVTEEMLTLENYEDRTFLVCPHMEQLFPASRKKFIEYFMDSIGRLMSNKNTMRRFIHLSPYNQLHNLQYLADNTVVPKLAKVWDTEVPVIIIGAGPSLKDEIEVLRTAGDRAILFAVDSALPYLFQENIVPDAYICIEADKPMYFFEDKRALSIPLFGKVETTHKLQDVHTGRKIYGYDLGLPEIVYEEYQVPVSVYRYGGNGATSFFAVCKELGVKNVILLGQDMAYSVEKTTHVGGRDEGYEEDERFVYENNLGETVQSRQDWHRFIRWYENAIPACRFEHVINTARHGVRIRGTEFISLDEALNRYGKSHESVEEMIEKAEKTFAGARKFDVAQFYQLCARELELMKEIVGENPRDEKRKNFRMYSLLSMYETADMEDDFVTSQREGMHKLEEYVKRCIKEVAEDGSGSVEG